MTLELLNSWQ